jgi:serine protease Do
MLRDVDPDLQRWLGLASSQGALVQDVTAGSPGARAGIRPYDVIVSVDGGAVADHDALIQVIAASRPGTTRALQVLRDGHHVTVPIKLAERPQSERQPAARRDDTPPARGGQGLGLAVRELDRQAATRLQLPAGMQGVFIWRVEAPGPASEAEIERGDVLLEINRQPIQSYADFSRLTAGLRPGDLVALYLYRPELDQRLLHTVRVE